MGWAGIVWVMYFYFIKIVGVFMFCCVDEVLGSVGKVGV